jgi:hypothetical protein
LLNKNKCRNKEIKLHRFPIKEKTKNRDYCSLKLTSPELDADIRLGKRVRPLLWELLGNSSLKTTEILDINAPITPICRDLKQSNPDAQKIGTQKFL